MAEFQLNRRANNQAVGQAEVSFLLPDPIWHPAYGFPVRKPWVAVIGDCFVDRLVSDVFRYGPLPANDCPVVVCLPRGRVGRTMDIAEATLPAAIEVLFIHLGANDLSSPSSDPSLVISELNERLIRLREYLPRLRCVGICLLSAQTTDERGNYDRPYIDGYNLRSSQFNKLVRSGAIKLPASVSVRYVDFCLKESDLRKTGFGPNRAARFRIGRQLELIIWHESVLQSVYINIPRPLESSMYSYAPPTWPEMGQPPTHSGAGGGSGEFTPDGKFI